MKKLFVVLVLTALVFAGCAKEEQKIVYVYNWTDYIDSELIKKFEEINKCQVVYDTYNSNENMLTKVSNTGSSYDVVFPSGDHVSIMKEKGLLEKLDKSKLKNLKNINPAILEKANIFDEGNEYSIPYFWGTAGLLYDKSKLTDDEMKAATWDILGEERFNGKNVVTMLDDPRSVVGAALKSLGLSLNDMSDESLSKAKEVLKIWDKNISQFDSDSYKNEIQDGTTWLAHGYNGDALQVMAENTNVGFVNPIGGSELWIDNFVILKNAENKELAYKFIDFLLDAENAKKNTTYVQYATPNLAAYNLLEDEIKNNKIIYPSQEYLKDCEFIKNVGEDIIKLNKVWEEIITQ